MLFSSEGVQQGDPMEPLLLGLLIHKLRSKMRSKFAVFYYHDGKILGLYIFFHYIGKNLPPPPPHQINNKIKRHTKEIK